MWETLTDSVRLQIGDCLQVLRSLPDNYVDSIVTDPPYGLGNPDPKYVIAALEQWFAGDREHVPNGKGFMGRDWDAFVPPPAVWDECLRVLKPGGHLAVFAGSRTMDLMGLSIRLAGFEMRDGIAAWLYGSGFPKSLDVSKAIDKAAGAEREGPGNWGLHHHKNLNDDGWSNIGAKNPLMDGKDAVTLAANQWQGWGTALKPAHEPIILARKPLAGTVAANVLEHGTGGINVDACRVASDAKLVRPSILRTDNKVFGKGLGGGVQDEPSGRWPTNVILAHHPDCGPDEAPGECVPGCQVAALDEQSGWRKDGVAVQRNGGGQALFGGIGHGENTVGARADAGFGGGGGASRFFPTFRYQAKAPKSERPSVNGVDHPTVKPLGLMRWLVKLVTPPGGIVLDCFAGSGTTGEACRDEGFRCALIESFEDYGSLIRSRLSETSSQIDSKPTEYERG